MQKQKHAKYYEGILQLRNPTKEIISFVRKKIEKSRTNIAKEIRLKNGIDLYLSSQRFTRQLGLLLQKRFPGILITSRKLHTISKKTGKRLYRVTVLFKYLPIKLGKQITFKGMKLTVVQIERNTIIAKELSGKKHKIKLKELADLILP
ncbi:hypothetical protein DRJ19_02800 [Candidatus Woesearchaeota archaeon]|nr:MAG: hypothetical protein DRJ19_02800 [Candidatus Woesearchaeota archaeon]